MAKENDAYIRDHTRLQSKIICTEMNGSKAELFSPTMVDRGRPWSTLFDERFNMRLFVFTRISMLEPNGHGRRYITYDHISEGG